MTTPRKGHFSPSAISSWARNTSPPPMADDIRIECFRRRCGVGRTPPHMYPPSLHHDFCTSVNDRNAVWANFVLDINDAYLSSSHWFTKVAAMSRLTDGVFVGFGVRPEWDPSKPVDPSQINVQTFASYHSDKPRVRAAITQLENIIREEIAAEHIMTFGERLHTVSPGAGYLVHPSRSSSQPLPSSRPPPPSHPPPLSAPPAPAVHSTPAAPPTPLVPLTPAASRTLSSPPSTRSSRTLSSQRLSTVDSPSPTPAPTTPSKPSRSLLSLPPLPSRSTPEPSTNASSSRRRGAEAGTSRSAQSDLQAPEPSSPFSVSTSSSRSSLSTRSGTSLFRPPESPCTPLAPFDSPALFSSSLPSVSKPSPPPPSPSRPPRARSTGKGKEKASKAPESSDDGTLSPAAVQYIADLGLSRRTQLLVQGEETPQSGLWEAIEEQRNLLTLAAAGLADAYGKPAQWVATQIYMGVKDAPKPRANGFTMFVKHTHQSLVEEGRELPRGSQLMVEVTKVASERWKAIPTSEKIDWLQKARDAQQEASDNTKKPIKRVRDEHIANSIEVACRRKVQPVLAELSQTTGCHALYIVTRNSVTDQYAPRNFCSDRLNEACTKLFKFNLEEIMLRLDAYVAGGLAEVARITGERRNVALRRLIREQVLSKLCASIKGRLNIPPEELPTNMEWVDYDNLCLRYRTELVGFPGGEVKNPNKIGSVNLLAEIEAALRTGNCFWRALTDEEWEARRKAEDERLLSGQKRTCKRKRANTTYPPPSGSSQSVLPSPSPTPPPSSSPFVSAQLPSSQQISPTALPPSPLSTPSPIMHDYNISSGSSDLALGYGFHDDSVPLHTPLSSGSVTPFTESPSWSYSQPPDLLSSSSYELFSTNTTLPAPGDLDNSSTYWTDMLYD
ncbi:hypothetical protein CONPUDRAFT_75605 [Coniophora puteana RWD-64-598 SS2]|uniref:HMG box domain-containing protein n=1 Tax=Coniophora puteana (strain RWD-64-598) TaxID=741705 RepID=A0A5M3MFK6_CONPW|nr:uncharacterized protein CONPUDRAFT_75605 [Coniophora puteana RWD-64-598 SS2]EIW77817.1 hypothetical protein CONPUDRAFT_75605 [Coniophora puteana RWD-64-598 SS2]